MRKFTCALATIVLCVGLCLQTRPTAQVGSLYIAEDIGSLGGTEVTGTAINDKGEIAGTATMPDGTYKAIRYSTDNGLEVIDAPALPDGLDFLHVNLMQAYGINNAGDVVGLVGFAEGFFSGFVARRGQQPQLITDSNGIPFSQVATAINDDGVVTGGGQGDDTFRWYPTGALDDLGVNGVRTFSWGINGSRQLSGYHAGFVGGEYVVNAFRYTDGVGFEDLGTLGSTNTAGVGINTSGVVVGWSELQPGRGHAFRAAPGEPMQDLGTLGGTTSTAQGINDAGDVVGVSDLANGQGHAFVYSDATGMIDLNDRVAAGTPRLDIAYGINRSGQIVVTYSLPNESHTFRLTPTTAVHYGVSVLFDQAKVHRAGSTVPIKVALLDQSGRNVSSQAISLVAKSLVQVSTQTSGVLDDSGNANSDNNFRYDATSDTYMYNLSTTGLTTGVWELRFVAGNDPTMHAVQFQVQ